MKIGAFNTLCFEVSNFKVETFKNFQQSIKHRYAEHQILNKVSKLESVGIEPQTLSLEVMLYKALGAEPKTEIAKLKQLCEDGIADFLIIGSEVISVFVIESVEVSGEVFNNAGDLILANVKLNFKEYV